MTDSAFLSIHDYSKNNQPSILNFDNDRHSIIEDDDIQEERKEVGANIDKYGIYSNHMELIDSWHAPKPQEHGGAFRNKIRQGVNDNVRESLTQFVN